MFASVTSCMGKAAFFFTTVLLGQQQPDDVEFTLRTETQLVVLHVGVQDSHGRNIKSLRQEAFHIYEDGRLQTIKQFSSEDRPVTIGIVVDASGSMRTRQAETVAAALAFVGSNNPDDETFVVNFNDRASLGLPPDVPFSNNAAELRAALLARKPEGKTALYDALILAATHMAKGKWERKALLLISDGGDNNSMHTLGEALHAVELSGAAVYGVALYDPEEPEHNLETLRRLAKMSGGEVFEPSIVSQIAGSCLRIAKDIRASYTLAYTPANSKRSPGVHRIKVAAASPAGKLRVRARTRYVLEDH